MKRKIILVASVAVFLISSAIGVFVLSLSILNYFEAQSMWRRLEKSVPSAPINESDPDTINVSAWLYGRESGPLEIGHLYLGNGQIVTFAFAFHHLLNTEDSQTIFRGREGEIRVKGPAFRCEVDFGNSKQPHDMRELAELMRNHKDKVKFHEKKSVP